MITLSDCSENKKCNFIIAGAFCFESGISIPGVVEKVVTNITENLELFNIRDHQVFLLNWDC